MFPKRAVWLLVGLHVLFAGLFAAIAPYRTSGLVGGVYLEDIGAPDEMAHSKYVQWLAEGKGLPPAAPPEMPTYEAHQPPLYYALAAAWAKVGFCRDFDSFRTGFWLRLMNALIGGLGVLGAARMAWAASKNPKTALVASAIAAMLPMNVGVSASINNDPLLICLGSWIAALLVEACDDGWTPLRAASIGTLIGLGLITKTSALVYFLPLFVCLFLCRKAVSPRYWFAVPALALLIASGIWMRNYALYNDPLMLKTFAVNSSLDAMPEVGLNLRAMAHFALVFIQNSTMSFFGMLGYMAIGFPVWVYVSLILFAGFLVLGAASGSRSRDADGKRKDWIAGSLLVGALLLYIRFNLEHTQPQARYFFTALAPIAYFFAVGFVHWFGNGFKKAYPTLLASLAALNIFMAGLMDSAYRAMQADLIDAGGPGVFLNRR